MLYSINYIYSNMLTIDVCFNEPQFVLYNLTVINFVKRHYKFLQLFMEVLNAHKQQSNTILNVLHLNTLTYLVVMMFEQI